MAALCRNLRDDVDLAVVTNDIYTTEDADFLRTAGVLDLDRIVPVRTGCCPHTAIRDDIGANLDAVEDLEAKFGPLDLVLVESGGDNLTATFSRGLADVQIFVLDVSGGDKVPRKGGPGVTFSDLLVINKTDLAPMVGASLEVMDRDAAAVREGRPVIFMLAARGPARDEGRGLGAGRTSQAIPDLTERTRGDSPADRFPAQDRAPQPGRRVGGRSSPRQAPAAVRGCRCSSRRRRWCCGAPRTRCTWSAARPGRSAATRSTSGSRCGPGPPCGSAPPRRLSRCPARTAWSRSSR